METKPVDSVPQPAKLWKVQNERPLQICPRCWGGAYIETGLDADGIPIRLGCPECQGARFTFAPRDDSDKAREILISRNDRGP